MKKLRVTVEGKTYEVLVEVLDDGAPPAAAPAPVGRAAPLPATAPVAPATPPPAAAAAGDIVSPLAGKVVSIDVRAGQAVVEGAQVATIEAMKMNTYVYAPRAGTVAGVLVNPGDSVEEGSPLVRLG